MEDHLKNIDDLFKEPLGDYRETPPPAVWDRLQQRLQPAPVASPARGYRWMWYFGAVSVLLLLGVSVAWKMTAGRNEVAGNDASHVASAAISKPAAHEAKSKAEEGHSMPSTPAKADIVNKPGQESSTAAGNAVTTSTEEHIGSGQHKQGKHAAKVSQKTAPGLVASANNNGYRAGTKAKSTGGPFANDEDEETSDNGTILQSGSKNARSGNNKPSKIMEAAAAKTDSVQNNVKKQPAKPIATTKNTPVNNKQKDKASFRRIEAGIKIGYERGFDNDGARKAVISPYVQYRISHKLAIMLQPGVKSAFLGSTRIDDPKSYYSVNADGNVTEGKVYPIYIADGSTMYKTTFTYTESHDSIVKANFTGGTWTELELPVLLKYYVGKNFSVYGGANIIYSKLTGISEHTSVYSHIVVSRDSSVLTYSRPDVSAAPSLRSVISYQGTPYSDYPGPQYPAAHGDLFRIGYMAGFSYEYNNRWLLDGLVQQGNVPAKVVNGYNTNAPLSVPYFRLSIGYKLIK